MNTQTNYHVGVKEYKWHDLLRGRNIETTVWYPTHTPTEKIIYLGCFTGHAKLNAIIADEVFPLIIFSHGSGGHRYNQSYLAEYLASYGYIVAAIQHPFNNSADNSGANDITNLWQRPKDVAYVIDQLLSDKIFKHYIDAHNIAIAGHSVGAVTALITVGAVLDIYHDAKSLFDTRIKAALLMAPALVHLFKKIHINKISAPLYLIFSGKDEVLDGTDKQYLDLLPRDIESHEFPLAGHFVYLMECSKPMQKILRGPCIDIGTPRHEIHPILKQQSLQFFDKTLKKYEKNT